DRARTEIAPRIFFIDRPLSNGGRPRFNEQPNREEFPEPPRGPNVSTPLTREGAKRCDISATVRRKSDHGRQSANACRVSPDNAIPHSCGPFGRLKSPFGALRRSPLNPH